MATVGTEGGEPVAGLEVTLLTGSLGEDVRGGTSGGTAEGRPPRRGAVRPRLLLLRSRQGEGGQDSILCMEP